VYRHFASKAALREAVLRGWLARSMAPLQVIANSRTPPPARLRQWFSTLRQTKRDNVLGDPELFATYSALAAEAGDAIAEHKGRMQQQIASIIAAGVASGDFRQLDPAAAARALFDATARFHYPGLSHLWNQPGEDAAFTQLLDLLLAGLAPAPAPPRRRKSAR
jgi:AcrR family transcriptional regulator